MCDRSWGKHWWVLMYTPQLLHSLSTWTPSLWEFQKHSCMWTCAQPVSQMESAQACAPGPEVKGVSLLRTRHFSAFLRGALAGSGNSWWQKVENIRSLWQNPKSLWLKRTSVVEECISAQLRWETACRWVFRPVRKKSSSAERLRSSQASLLPDLLALSPLTKQWMSLPCSAYSMQANETIQ